MARHCHLPNKPKFGTIYTEHRPHFVCNSFLYYAFAILNVISPATQFYFFVTFTSTIILYAVSCSTNNVYQLNK